MRAPSHLPRLIGALALTLWIAGCSDDATGDDPDAAVTADALATDAEVPVDASPDAGTTSEDCVDLLSPGVSFDLDPSGPDMQFQAAVAFDGQGVWVTYVLPGANNYFDIWAVRVACDGSVLWGPERLNTTDNNETVPSVAAADGNVYFAWQADDNTGGLDNMDIFVRTFQADGTPIMALDQSLETTKDGTAVTKNAWMPQVTALPNGQFAVAGARAPDDASTFQVFVQRLTDDGSLVGEALDAMWEPTVSQFYPSLAAQPDGTIYLAYERSPVDGDEQILHTHFAPGADGPDPDPPVAAQSNTLGLAASYATDPTGTYVYLAFGNGSQVVLTDGADFGDGAQTLLNQGSAMDYAPVVVATADGGAVFWYLNISGYNNSFLAAPFSFNGTAFTVGTTQNVTLEVVPPYRPAVTHVMGNVYFAAWSEGSNPDFRIRGRFLELN